MLQILTFHLNKKKELKIIYTCQNINIPKCNLTYTLHRRLTLKKLSYFQLVSLAIFLISPLSSWSDFYFVNILFFYM